MFANSNLAPNFPQSDPKTPWSFASSTTLLLLGSLLASCSGSGGGGSSTPPVDDTNNTVTETLNTLGVDTTETAAVDDSGAEYPEGYSPLGARHELEKLSELIVLGAQPEISSARLSLWDLEHSPLFPGREPQLLKTFDSETVPWALERTSQYKVPVTKRSGVSADLDGDGREEQLYAHFDAEWMRFTIIEDAEAEYDHAEIEVFPLSAECFDVKVTSADVDGDGDDEIILGYSTAFEATIAVFDYKQAAVITEPIAEEVFEPRHEGNLLMLELAAGNLDYDTRDELGLVINEFYANLNDFSVPADEDGCTAIVLDDITTGFEVLYEAAIEIEDEFGILHQATSGNLDIGDLDADGLCEIVFAGSANPDETFCLGRYVLISLDDAAHGLTSIGSKYLEHAITDGDEAIVDWTHVDLVDLTGDHACEVHVNDLLFPDWKSAEAWSTPHQLTGCYPTNPYVGMNPSTVAFTAADFTGDIRQDLAMIAHGKGEITVWGIDAEDPDQELAILDRIPIDCFGVDSQDRNPQLIAVNPDSDSTMLEFIDHTYVMTEPVIMAVLAAAPNTGGPGQAVDQNSTEFGTAASSGSSFEHQLSVSVGFSVGSEFQLWGNGWEVEAKLQADYEQVWSYGSEVTRSMSFATGPEEDTVICTVAPYDVYRYRVVMDPDPESIGEVVQLMIPRTPITMQVERDFYNSATGNDSIKIDSSVLQHTIGDLSSYPTKLEKNAKLAATQGLETGPVGVGPGAGATSLGITVANESGSSSYIGVSTELSASTTVGTVKVGGSFGLGYGHTWSWSVGSETSYSGTVGGIDAEHFADDHFAFGLFCYWHRLPESGEAFQIINYWIE